MATAPGPTNVPSSIPTASSYQPPPQTTIWSLPCSPSPDPTSCDIPFVTLATTTILGYQSPAICPLGYTAACTWFNTFQGLAPTPAEEAWNCLPDGFECYSNWPGWGTQTVSGSRISTPLVGIRWASSDLSRLQTHPLTPGLVLAEETSNFGSTTSSPTNSSPTHAATPIPSPNPSSGLSGDTIAGAVVGVIVIVILAVVLVLLFIRRRRRRRTEDASPAVNLETDGYAKPELHGNSKAPANNTAVELNADIEAQAPMELPADSSPISVAHSRRDTTYISLLQPLSSFVDGGDDSPGTQHSPETAPESPQSAIPASLIAPTTIPPTSTFEQAGTTNNSPNTNQAEEELAQLRRKQAEIAERRERLLQLEQLAEEERRIQQRIDELGEQSPSSPHQ